MTHFVLDNFWNLLFEDWNLFVFYYLSFGNFTQVHTYTHN
jgi:hypothetical protein